MERSEVVNKHVWVEKARMRGGTANRCAQDETEMPTVVTLHI